MTKNHKSPAKKSAPKPAAKKVPPAPARSAAVKAPPSGKPAKSSPTMEKPSKKTALRDSILKRKAASKPIAFSLDEVRAIAQTVTSKPTTSPFPKTGAVKAGSSKPAAAGLEKAKPQHVKAASLA